MILLKTHDRLSRRYYKVARIIKMNYIEFCERMRYSEVDELNRCIYYFWNSYPLTPILFRKAKALMKKKNNDYADIKDPFLNFRQCEEAELCSVLTGMLVRLGDKVSRFDNLYNKKKKQMVKDESIEDTLIDIINYCVIIRSYLDYE